jgi:PPOX class probable F420-dependent enzyme
MGWLDLLLPAEATDELRSKLSAARNYWVTTVGPGGAPQSTPVWAIWTTDTLYFTCGRDTKKARNLARNPRLDVHLESGDEVVVVHGIAHELADPSLEPPLISAFREKYGHEVIPDSMDALNGRFYAVRPRAVLAWMHFPTDVTRWDFGPAGGR